MTDSPLHSVSVAGVVVDDTGRALLIQRRDNGRWEPPGGILELDESIEEGVVREVREESGLTVAVERLTGVYKNTARGIVALVFRCHPLSGTATPTREAIAIQWAEADEVPSLADEVYAIRILDALHSTMPQIRTHDGHRITQRATTTDKETHIAATRVDRAPE